MSSYLSTNGFVLHKMKYNDFDYIVTFFTESVGKITTFVKGCRKKNAKYQSHFELFNHNKIILYKGKNWYHLIQSTILDTMHEPKNKLEKAKSLFSISEMVLKTIPEQQPLLNQIYFCIRSHIEAIRIYPNQYLSSETSFTIKLIKLIGILGRLGSCSHCEKPIIDASLYFSFENNSLMCQSCKSRAKLDYSSDNAVIPITRNTAILMNYILEKPVECLYQKQVAIKELKQISAICRKILENHIKKELNTYKCFE